ncbi:FAD-dependent oxidoreductase [Membranihabitans maritimus]|uniref:FAD-dependent oxidoreductase n=1 Tax=Membranihabitans maritimus TaxID=2904244 RepID=UPI001F326227|nr:FAD-dependent oxidoreductase [Membranihabitans maritimus]
MKNRRSFLKSVGIGSGALFFNPEMGFCKSSELVKEELENNGVDVYREKEYDVDIAVIGGGISGICAAIAAARNGSSVVLIHDRSRLGGNASSEIRMHVSGSSVLETVWREVGILEEMMLDDSVTNPQNAYPMWDFVMYNKVISEPNITLLLDTMMYEAEAENNVISSVKAFCSQTEELYTVKANHFADCTGDGTLAALVGAEFMRGREAKSKWDESLGQDIADEVGMGNSLLFMADKFDDPMPYTPPDWARKYTFKDFEHRGIRSIEYGYWWLELAGKYDIINDGQILRHELLAVLFGVWDYIKNSGNHPESENWALTWVGMIPGKRESRRIVGDVIMTQRDTQVPQNYPDRVAYGGWPLDDHPAEGMDDTSIKPNRAVHLKGPYSIPLRSLYSKNVQNLWMAGRNISVSHVALSSSRVMATCSTLGQAVGTAMNYCLKRSISSRELATTDTVLKDFQQKLLRQDQSILNVVNEDGDDLARKASLSFSSETEEGPAKFIIDGYNRKVEDGKSHQWQAEMNGGQPWVELRWNSPVNLNTVELTFDTGLNRYLRISGQKVVMENQIRGAQPETVSDYRIEFFYNKKLVYSDFISNNYYRKVSHEFKEIKTDALRITIFKTHGDPLARIFEVRCYNES